MTIQTQIANYLNLIAERDNCDCDTPAYEYFDALAEYKLSLIMAQPDGVAQFNQLVNSQSFRSANGFSGGYNV